MASLSADWGSGAAFSLIEGYRRTGDRDIADASFSSHGGRRTERKGEAVASRIE